MKKDSKFAVVDIEASDNFNHGGKIIQIAMVFVENWKITGSFNTFINPGRRISKRITELTDITNEDVSQAPFFSEIADKLYEKLRDTVFVGHNVNFDYEFINGELERAGHKKLRIERIDTLALTQILYPTLERYGLANLSNELNITLSHNHLANLDALATAQLFIKLFERANTLPVQTVKQLQKLKLVSVGSTGKFFNLIEGTDSVVQYENLGDNVLVRKNIKENRPVSNEEITINDIDLSTDLRIEERQLELADILLNSKTNPSVLITRDRFGKSNTILYLSILNILNSQNTIIIGENRRSTSHINRKWKDIFSIYSTGHVFGQYVLPDEFIDIPKFKKEISKSGTNREQVIKARLLVWLLETNWGNFEELTSAEMNDIQSKLDISQHNLKNKFYQMYSKVNNQPAIAYTTEDKFDEVNFDDFDNVIFTGEIDPQLIGRLPENKRVIHIKKSKTKLNKPYQFLSVL